MTELTKVCVLGIGLIGGSILRAVGPAHSFGWNHRAATADKATAAGWDVSTDLPKVLQRASEENALVVIAVPMPAVDSTLEAIATHAPTVALTDVVSVKQPVLDAVTRRGLVARYVGGHPMAGTASSGWDAADAELFRDCTWLVAADDGADPTVWRAVANLAAECGAKVVAASSAEHDAAVARISHLPHVLAEALAVSGGKGGPLALSLAAGSFRDGTRVAASAPALVRAICEPNRQALLAVLDECLSDLAAARDALAAEGHLGALVDEGHAARTRLEAHDTSGRTTLVPGEPGWIETARAAGAAGQALTLG